MKCLPGFLQAADRHNRLSDGFRSEILSQLPGAIASSSSSRESASVSRLRPGFRNSPDSFRVRNGERIGQPLDGSGIPWFLPSAVLPIFAEQNA